MPKSHNVLACLGLAAALVAGAGCFDDEVAGHGPDGHYDKGALDMYLSDVERPIVEVSVSTPTSYTSFFGEWEAKIDMEAEMEKEKAERKKDPNYDPAMEEFGEAFAGAMAEMMSFSLNIKEDKTFMMTMMFFPIEGHWEQKGDQLFLHPDKVMGMSKEEMKAMAGPDGEVEMKNEEPLVLKISTDGKTLTAIDPKGEFGSEELVFKRKQG